MFFFEFDFDDDIYEENIEVLKVGFDLVEYLYGW